MSQARTKRGVTEEQHLQGPCQDFGEDLNGSNGEEETLGKAELTEGTTLSQI
jgi:hypothetical protein